MKLRDELLKLVLIDRENDGSGICLVKNFLEACTYDVNELEEALDQVIAVISDICNGRDIDDSLEDLINHYQWADDADFYLIKGILSFCDNNVSNEVHEKFKMSFLEVETNDTIVSNNHEKKIAARKICVSWLISNNKAIHLAMYSGDFNAIKRILALPGATTEVANDIVGVIEYYGDFDFRIFHILLAYPEIVAAIQKDNQFYGTFYSTVREDYDYLNTDLYGAGFEDIEGIIEKLPFTHTSIPSEFFSRRIDDYKESRYLINFIGVEGEIRLLCWMYRKHLRWTYEYADAIVAWFAIGVENSSLSEEALSDLVALLETAVTSTTPHIIEVNFISTLVDALQERDFFKLLPAQLQSHLKNTCEFASLILAGDLQNATNKLTLSSGLGTHVILEQNATILTKLITSHKSRSEEIAPICEILVKNHHANPHQIVSENIPTAYELAQNSGSLKLLQAISTESTVLQEQLYTQPNIDLLVKIKTGYYIPSHHVSAIIAQTGRVIELSPQQFIKILLNTLEQLSNLYITHPFCLSRNLQMALNEITQSELLPENHIAERILSDTETENTTRLVIHIQQLIKGLLGDSSVSMQVGKQPRIMLDSNLINVANIKLDKCITHFFKIESLSKTTINKRTRGIKRKILDVDDTSRSTKRKS